MKKDQTDIDGLTRDLLSKSMLSPASSDFDDRLMEQIVAAPSPARVKSNGNITKKAWFFLWVTIGFMILSLTIVSAFSGNYFTEISQLFKVIFTYVLYGGLALFIPLLLYQFDTLLKLMYWKKEENLTV